MVSFWFTEPLPRWVGDDDTEKFTGADIENWVIESVKRLRKKEEEENECDTLDADTLSETLDEILENRERKKDTYLIGS